MLYMRNFGLKIQFIESYALNNNFRIVMKGAIMKLRSGILIIIVLIVYPLFAAEIKLSAIKIPAENIGKKWSGPAGIVIDNFDSPPEEAKEIAITIKKQVEPFGVIGTADFTYQKKDDPSHQVTIRIFVFKTSGQCQEWMKTKCQFDGWEKKYRKVENPDYICFDSLEIKKRIVALDNFWITAGTIANSDDYLNILNLYIKKVQDIKTCKLPFERQ